MRGTAILVFDIYAAHRITPACAGNRSCSLSSSFLFGDHPRVCGEQKLYEISENYRAGSPPRVRGTGPHKPCAIVIVGITPACAGNRVKKQTFRFYEKDHPRVCGEQKPPSSEWKHSIGSPPRVRGTDGVGFRASGPEGITPACAGNRMVYRISLPMP